ncbi:MFS transporter [Nocardia sp. NPDC058176]|uniref:MFS transporter n=1 Tax=Nocardia sp. NPDC058176 TaxID=3346368 RepID=UPI0036DDBADA
MTKSQRFVLAVVCAVAVSTIYAIQPVLASAGADLGFAPGAVGWLVAAGQIGYVVGLLLVAPLGDVLNRRRLIAAQLVATALGTALVACAPGAVVAVVGLVVTGVFAVVVQVTVAYVAGVSPPWERGRNIGAVTSGVVVGILGGRAVAGVLGDALGWRAVFGLLAVLCLALAGTVGAVMSPDGGRDTERYRRILAATGRLVRTDPLFRSRGLIAFFLFASFGTLWSGLALVLGAEPWNFGAAEIGVFGLAGLAGALGASRAGRLADAGRAQAVTGWSLALLVVSWLFIGRAESSLLLLFVGIIALDFAVQAVHVSSQQLLTARDPQRAAGVIGAYMACYSLGSALGAITTAWAYSAGGWAASSGVGAVFSVAAIVVWVTWRFGDPAHGDGVEAAVGSPCCAVGGSD